MNFNILTLIIISVFLKLGSGQPDNSNLGDVLLTASNTQGSNEIFTSIEGNQFGTFLLHLPSTIKSTYTPYLSDEKETTTGKTISKISSVNSLNRLPTQYQLQSTNIISNVGNITTSKFNLYKQSVSSSKTISEFKTQTRLGVATYNNIPYQSLLLMLTLMFL